MQETVTTWVTSRGSSPASSSAARAAAANSGGAWRMYAALQAAGADVQYTEFPGINHNSWDSTFKQEGLLKWIFSKELGN